MTLVQTDTGLSLALWGSDGAMLMTRPLALGGTIVFSPDGSRVLLSNVVVDARTGAIERDVASTLFSTLWGQSTALTLNGDGTRVATVDAIGGESEVPAVYDLASGAELRLFGTLPRTTADRTIPPLLDMSMSANGQFLATSDTQNQTVFRIDPTFEKSVAIHSAVECSQSFRISLSGDGEMLLCSGDGWTLSRTFTGEDIDGVPPPPEDRRDNCNWSVGSLSPQGTWLVVGAFGPSLNIRQTPLSSAPWTAVPSARCNGRAAFNADESLMATTGPELYRTADWTRIWPATVETHPSQNNSPLGDVQFLPGGRELLISSCGTPEFPVAARDLFRCTYALYSAQTGQALRQLPDLTAYKAAVSPEGHWVISGATLQHLPTGTLRTLDLDGQSPSLSIFTPNGDIIANMPDNTLVRYCRSVPVR